MKKIFLIIISLMFIKTIFLANQIVNIDNKFTIHVSYVFKQNLNNFINKYILNDDYIVLESENLYRILYGIYNTKKLANNALKSISNKRINKTKIIKVSSLNKKEHKFLQKIKNNKLSVFYYLIDK